MSDVIDSKVDTDHHRNGNGSRNQTGSCPACAEFSALIARFISVAEATERQVQALSAEVRKALIPIAEENRHLHEQDADRRIMVPFALEVIAMLERQSAEVEQIDQGALALSYIDKCRAVDQKEVMNMLQRRGIEEIKIPRGSEPNPETHDVERVRPTHDKHKHGRISRLLRRGYWRRHDSFLIKPAAVEVWGPAVAEA